MGARSHKQSNSGGSSAAKGRPAPAPLQRSATTFSSSSFSSSNASSAKNTPTLSSLGSKSPMFQSISRKTPSSSSPLPSPSISSSSSSRTEILAVPTMSFKSQRGQPVNPPSTRVDSNSDDMVRVPLRQARTMPVIESSNSGIPTISDPAHDSNNDVKDDFDRDINKNNDNNNDAKPQEIPTIRTFFNFLSSAKTALEVSGIEETLEYFSWTDRDSSRGLEKQIVKELQQAESATVHAMIEPDIQRESRLVEALDRGIAECLDLEKKLGVYKMQLKVLLPLFIYCLFSHANWSLL